MLQNLEGTKCAFVLFLDLKGFCIYQRFNGRFTLHHQFYIPQSKNYTMDQDKNKKAFEQFDNLSNYILLF